MAMAAALALRLSVLLAAAAAKSVVRRDTVSLAVGADGQVTSGPERGASAADSGAVSASPDAAGSASLAAGSDSIFSSQYLRALDVHAERLFDSISDIKFNRTTATEEELDNLVKEWRRVKTIVIQNTPKPSQEEQAKQDNAHCLDSLKNSHGEGHAIFTVCVGLVQGIGGDPCNSLGAIESGCVNASTAKPTLKCARLKRQMGIQCNLTKDATFLKSADSFCAHTVCNAVPIEEEPPCMHFMEDVVNLIAARDLAKAGGRPISMKFWPAIIDDSTDFADAFMDECLADSPGETAKCSGLLAGLRAAKPTLPTDFRNQSQSVLLARLCPLVGKPLPTKFAHFGGSQNQLWSKRGAVLNLYYKAARLTHGINESSLVKRSSNLLRWPDGTWAADGPRLCCDNHAQRFSIGPELSLGYTAAGGIGYGLGYKRWDNDNCVWGGCGFYHYCLGVGPDMGVDGGIDAENYYNYGGISGKSEVVGGGLCLILCSGYGNIHEMAMAGQGIGSGRKIGWVHEFGGGLGVDFAFTQCNAECHRENLGEQITYRNECPGSSCFPAKATVETPTGSKPVSDLRVGEKVLAVDETGKLFFDDVYFFGHADAAAEELFVGIALSGKSEELQLSSHHFIQICPGRRPCLWSEKVHVYAEAVREGDYVFALLGDDLKEEHRPTQVMKVSNKVERGLYNPYTLSGSIVVDGVVASAHSNWVLDPWMPASWSSTLPYIYQWLFLPGRWLYHVAGPPAADFLGLANPTADAKPLQDSSAALTMVQV